MHSLAGPKATLSIKSTDSTIRRFYITYCDDPDDVIRRYYIDFGNITNQKRKKPNATFFQENNHPTCHVEQKHSNDKHFVSHITYNHKKENTIDIYIRTRH